MNKEIKISLGTAICICIIIVLVMALIGMWLYYNKGNDELSKKPTENSTILNNVNPEKQNEKASNNTIENSLENRQNTENNISNKKNLKITEGLIENSTEYKTDSDIYKFIENYLNDQNIEAGIVGVKYESETEDINGDKIYSINVHFYNYSDDGHIDDWTFEIKDENGSWEIHNIVKT